MKVTFPHMGNMYICVKALLDDLNIDYVIPPFTSKRTLEIGTRYVPECACLPLKITLGNLLEAKQLGADTVLMAGGCGPCRFGYYCEMHREILYDLGTNMKVFTLEPPHGDIKEFFKKIRELTNGAGVLKILNAITNATRIAIAVDELERLAFRLRPREIEKGSVNNIYRQFKKEIVNSKGSKEIMKSIRETERKLSQIKINENLRPLKIGIVGEIYTTIDDYTSFGIQQKLGGMIVEVHRYVTVSNWITEHMIKQSLKLPRDLSYAKAARPYLGTMIGGHAQETIGNTIIYARNGYDGVIQIYPLTCMPEIVAESILPAVEKDYDIPVLTLIIDEMTGEAGY
ncbi:MAG: CoA protein activase, partial [Clostridiaceae bacterium]|nr:CoA protein activase [Clostridiaceae bacterium]